MAAVDPADLTEPTAVAAPAAEPEISGDEHFRPSPAGWTARGAVVAGVVALVVGVPLVREPLDSFEFAGAAIFAIIGLSLNVLIGYTGTISLGHNAFVGVGAFTTAYVVGQSGQPFLLGVAAATLIGALQSLILGGLALRISGLYFALITLSYGVMAQESIFGISAFTGGGAGASAPAPTGPVAYYFICLAFLGVVLWVDWRLIRSKGGRALLALRENPRVAASLGINVKAHTLMAFMVAGAFAGLGGALLAHRNVVVSPTTFSFQLALLFVIMTVVGGLRSRVGIIIGSSLFALLTYLVRTVPGFERTLARWDLVIPLVLVVAGAAIVINHLRRRGPLTPFVVVAGLVALLALLVLSPVTVPYLEARLSEIPRLNPEASRNVVGPVLLLLVLTRLPGGIGQLTKPVQLWLRGERFDWSVGKEKEVQITDVRA
ncbi:MAG TPA: branched-chain amino acid ABC transporter permease [Acidimicrobiales bacterium]|nr:branched-chain amino acid ABC transporter permease [Acidimicrobiales bacterium]